ncbi:MAG: hypothetical protein NWF00_10270 [Candidatus Bathyarchaeota archaeon]|nr:hypothetical protein [Candidatus Bathyarchaeota archaeon]
MKNSYLLTGVLMATLICVFVSVFTANFGTAQTYTDVVGVIRSDTTWTKSNSPYRLTGPVAVNEGVTLTIEAGVHVDFNSDMYMQVNGTLVAKGSDSEPVSFLTDGEIRFMPSSKSWDKQTGVGSVIKYGNMPSSFKITINGASPKIDSSYGRPVIVINDGSPLIVNNRFRGPITSLTINCGIPIVSGNKLSSFRVIVEDGSPIIFNNSIQSPDDVRACIEVMRGNPYISNNNIVNCRIGISAAYGVVERNFISSANIGVEVGNGIIRNNTIESVTNILVQASSTPVIAYNNFPFATVGGRDSVALAEKANFDVDAAYNWWGTTDVEAINQSIYDFKKDFSLGTVNFVPFLTEPNPQAMPDSDAPLLTSPPDTPSPSPTIPEMNPTTVLAVVAALSCVFVGAFKKRVSQKRNQ